jgi:UDP-N-acetylmuramate dehydrogenase
MNHAPACITSSQHVGSTTYYGIGGTAAFYARPRGLKELAECLRWAQAHALPIGIFGSGSNALMADGTFEGLIVTLAELTTSYWETENTLYVEAGVTNTEVAEICLDAGRAGAAWMYRMPGQLGATIRMNARCYGGEISQIASEIFTMDMSGQLRIHSGVEVFHGYKKTLLMDSPEVVVAARLFLPQTAPREELLGIMESCESDRHRKHHFEHPSCGSTFKNNYSVGRPSGQVFDECGLKGTRVGQSEVSQFHANFVWNLGGATASDMLTLAAHMRERAQTLKQADLELEVQPIGLFSSEVVQRCALERLGPLIPQGNAQWVGLHWHPATKPHENHPAEFKKNLLAAPFQDYFRTPGCGEPELSVRLVQLKTLAEAEKNPESPFVRWETHKKNTTRAWSELFPVKPAAPVGFVDELWNSSVSELFIANAKPGATEYLEFECTPEGHWVAIAFSAPRVRKAEHIHPKGELWPDFHFEQHDEYFSVNFSYSRLAPLIHRGELLVQACLSLGNQSWLLAPHWSESGSPECWDTQHKPDVKPDFHQPRRFWRVALD